MGDLAVTSPETGAELLERVVVSGDLAKLRPEERLLYYRQVCASVGLNPLTRPLEYITLNGKLVLYARKDATEQLRKLHGVSVSVAARELVEDCYVVTARATDRGGRTDESVGAVAVGGLRGEAKANAIMKAETKAKRRVTLSICGLGMLDETEVETIPGAVVGELGPVASVPALAAADGSEVERAVEMIAAMPSVGEVAAFWRRLTTSDAWATFTVAERTTLTVAKDAAKARLA